jgi:hypothetical protein
LTISGARKASEIAIDGRSRTAHGRCPSHRLACRMVKAARDARLPVALTQHSNRVSTPTPVSTVGKRDFARQRQRPRKGPGNPIDRLQRQMGARMPASSGLFALNWEISVCAGLRGGVGRTRTSNQAVIVKRWAKVQPFCQLRPPPPPPRDVAHWPGCERATGFARRYENGRETSVANRVGKPLKLLCPCSPLGSASKFNTLARSSIFMFNKYSICGSLYG